MIFRFAFHWDIDVLDTNFIAVDFFAVKRFYCGLGISEGPTWGNVWEEQCGADFEASLYCFEQ
jgi:hypothetical protein